MNRILADFIAGKNVSANNETSNPNAEGIPCMQINYNDWKELKNPSSAILWMIKDHPSADDIKNGNTSANGLLPPSGKIFKGKVECMKKNGEELIDVLLRHGWNGGTQVYNTVNNTSIIPDDPVNNKPVDNSDDLVLRYEDTDSFPSAGAINKLYYSESNETLYHFDNSIKKYKPISELVGKVIIDGN